MYICMYTCVCIIHNQPKAPRPSSPCSASTQTRPGGPSSSSETVRLFLRLDIVRVIKRVVHEIVYTII